MLSITKISKRASRIFASLVLMTAQMTPFFVFSGTASANNNNENEDKVTICHRTNSATNPYVKLSVNKSAVDGVAGNSGNEADHFGEHKGPIASSVAVAKALKDNKTEWGDIIPQVSPHHTGLNWDSVGQEILRNDCDIREDTSVVLIKKIVPSNSPDKFDLNITRSGSDLVVDNGGDGATSAKIEISDTSDLNVYETPGNNISDLKGYSTYIECVNLDDEVLESGSRTGDSSRGLTVDKSDIDEGDQITCTFTNTAKTGKLKVVKEIVDGGIGTKTLADFTFKLNGGTAQSFTPVDSDTGQKELTLPLGTNYSVVEPEANTNDYVTTYSGCSQVTLVEGQTKTCTITNTYQKGRVIVNKSVVNDDGGTLPASSFTVNVGNQSSAFTNTGEGTGTATFYIAPGATTVSEDTVAGYLPSYAKDCAQGVMNVSARQTVICDITNNDQPGSITLIKTVKNDDGGKKEVKDFDLYVQQGNSPKVDVESGISLILKAGSYKASETQLPGYESAGWTGDCDLSGNFTVALGQSAVCYIINDDKPGRIIVHKDVVNDNGGSKEADDFKFRVNSGQWQYFNSYGFNEVEVDAGWYTVSEYEDDAYKASYKDCYKIYVKNGETKHCFIKNDDKAPEVKVIKWTNPHWSTQDFNFTIRNNENTKNFTLDGHPYDDYTPSHYETSKYLQAGVVEITESDTEGWFLESVRCYVVKNWGLYPIPHPIKAELGKEYVCKFINTQYGRVEVTKVNDLNNNGKWDEGEPTLSGWEMNLEGQDFEDNCEVDLEVSAIALFEQAESNQLPVCDYDDESDNVRHEFTGENGVAVFEDVNPGEKYELSETLKDGWVQTDIFCEDDREEYEFSRNSREYSDDNEDENEDSVWLYVPSGETVECYVLNTKVEVDLGIDKSDSGVTTQAGANYKYTLDIKNSSELFEATEVTVTDKLDNNLKFVSYTGTDWLCTLAGANGSGFGGTLTCVYQKALPTKSSAPTITVTVQVSANPTVTSVDNIAEVTGKEFDPNKTNNKDSENTPISKPQVLGATTTPTLAKTGTEQTYAIVAGLLLVLTSIVLTSKKTVTTRK